MARWTPVPVAGGAYSDDCLPWASQDTVNYIPVMAEKAGTRSPAMLRCLPGCTTFSITGSNAPVRGMRNIEGRLLAVSGNALYRIGTDGAADSLGTIPGVARCSLAHNQISGGHEVAIANGQSGYIYNTATDTLAQITDEGFPGAKVFGFVDGYLMFVEPQGRFFGWSDLAAGTSYNTLDRSEAEAQPDRIVTGIESHGEWLVLGERSGEFYRNAGTTTGTFQRIPGTTMEVGCAGTHAVGKVDNSVIWVGHDGTVYRLNGYQPQRISTHAIEQQLSRCNLAQAFVTVFEDRGHKVWYLTCPDGKTWGYDVATGEWHRRKSDGLNRWRMNALVRWQGQWMAGDMSNGRIYQLDWAIQHEDGAEMERRRVFPVMHDNQNALTVNALGLVFDTGLGEASNPLPVSLLPPFTISGDLSDAELGAVASGSYAIAGGVPPYGSVTVTSGAFPTGLTLASSGAWTGTLTTLGGYAWTVQVTDADGSIATLSDTCTVSAGNQWDATKVFADYALSNGNRTVTQATGGVNSGNQIAVSGRSTGKWYFEVQGAGQFTGSPTGTFGVGPAGASPNGGALGQSGAPGAGMGSHGWAFNAGVTSSRIAAPYPGNNRCMVAFDADTGKLWFGVLGAWVEAGDPAAGTAPFYTMAAGTYFPMVSLAQVAAAYTICTTEAEALYTPPAGFDRWLQ